MISNTFNNMNDEQVEKSKIIVYNLQNNQTYNFEVHPWINVIELKIKIEHLQKIQISKQKLFINAIEMQNSKNLIDYKIKKRQKIQLIISGTKNKQIRSSTKNINQSLRLTLEEINKGFNKGIVPKLTFEGTSGTYFLFNDQKKIKAIFKPQDEEPYAPYNPRGLTGQLGSTGLRNGILSGECAQREFLAYLLDHNNFHSVPPTIIVEINHQFFQKNNDKIKEGSLQNFIDHDDIVSNFGCSMFQLQEVQKIAILDIRINNCDRNEENILIQRLNIQTLTKDKKQIPWLQFIPIDHGLSFPDVFETFSYEIIWMDWPQAKEPFTQESLDFIKNLDPFRDSQLIEQNGKMRDICIRNFIITELGLTLLEIGGILYREEDDQITIVQKLIQKTQLYINSIDDTLKYDSKISDDETADNSQQSLNSKQNQISSKKLEFEQIQNGNIPMIKIPENGLDISNGFQRNFSFNSGKKLSPNLKLTRGGLECQRNSILKRSTSEKSLQKLILKNQNNKKQLNDQNDLFFHIFQQFLLQHIQSILKNRPRQRFYSEVIQ